MQFIDLKAQYAALKAEMDAAIDEVLDEGQYIMGRHVGAFETALAEYVGVKHVVSCANGTDALQMLYMAYGIGAGDAVFCPDITFIATIEPACMLGATPVFCDVSRGDYNMDPESLQRQIQAVLAEGKLTPRAVVPIDFLGNPADYEALRAIAKQYNMILIEDAAQSIGSRCGNAMCGALGDAAIASFFPAKPLGCYGDGGAVLTDDGELADLCRSIRVHGKGTSKYANIRIGLNSRLDTLQAAVLLVKLRALQAYEMEQRQVIAQRYHEALGHDFTLLKVEKGNVSAYAQYAVLAETTAIRDKIVAHLATKEIPSMVYYPAPQHTLPVFEGVSAYGEPFSAALDYCARTFSLPMHPYLDEATQETIITSVLEAVR